MSVKVFTFAFEDITQLAVALASASAAKVADAFKAVMPGLPPLFADKQPGLRLFRIRMHNGMTGEETGFIGQGYSLEEAWDDGVKGSKETFMPKNDGKSRPQRGVTILLAPRPGDTYALGRAVSRSIESFESDETFAQERLRVRLEAERQRQREAGFAA